MSTGASSIEAAAAIAIRVELRVGRVLNMNERIRFGVRCEGGYEVGYEVDYGTTAGQPHAQAPVAKTALPYPSGNVQTSEY
jgi:hypothetical protein